MTDLTEREIKDAENYGGKREEVTMPALSQAVMNLAALLRRRTIEVLQACNCGYPAHKFRNLYSHDSSCPSCAVIDRHRAERRTVERQIADCQGRLDAAVAAMGGAR